MKTIIEIQINAVEILLLSAIKPIITGPAKMPEYPRAFIIEIAIWTLIPLICPV